MKKNIIITLDGYSACGKSTLAKALAKSLGFIYIDTGAMYRALTLFFQTNSMLNTDGTLKSNAIDQLDKIYIDFSEVDSEGNSFVQLNGEIVESSIRSLEISNLVSQVSKYKLIRKKLVKIQQSFGVDGQLVMDGRDIGTQVFPNAEVKFWITASTKHRVQRRLDEMLEKGMNVDFTQVLANVKTRDFQDKNRKESPLRKPENAIVIDNSNISVEETLNMALKHVNSFIE